jgi:1-acyl-sn-glycerol-3-phosphate acyltransferase
MKSKQNFLFILYQWIIAFPILLVITILTSIFTIILSPLLPNQQISYLPARWWAKSFCTLLFINVNIVGLEYLDSKQSYILVSNHQSIFDIFVVYGWLPTIFKWIMKAELRKIPLVGKACESAGHIFMDRSNSIAAKHSIEKAEAQLKDGVSVVIFPEGTRTRNGEMGSFKKGAFRIAADLRLPIVPITIRGSFERLHRNSLNVHPGIIEMIVHKPIDVNAFLPDQITELIQQTWVVINDDLI